jgi:cytochrome c551
MKGINHPMKRSICSFFLWFTLVISLSACGQSTTPGASSPEPASGESVAAADAKMTYKNFCMSCHGGNLEGFKGPNLQKVGERMSEEQIIKQIQKGGDGMPGFGVSIKEQDIQALAQWLASKK